MTAKDATSGAALTAAAVVAGRYLRDLHRARARLARLERRSRRRSGRSSTASGAKATRSYSSTASSAAATCRRHGERSCPWATESSRRSRFGYLGSPLPEATSTARQADAFAHLFDALGIARAPVLAFSAGNTSAVQLALRHPERVSALVLAAANSPHEKPVTLAPRSLAPLVFSQPTLWFLRVFLPSKLAAIAGKPHGYEVSVDDRHTLEKIFDSFFPMRPRAKGIIFDGYVGNPEIGTCAFERITVPTLGVHAADDPLASYDDARAMVARIPGSRWVHVEHGGHIFIHNDERAKREIAAFLAANARSEVVEPREHALAP